jgi:tetratricopeptide (TPR) repeat protein
MTKRSLSMVVAAVISCNLLFAQNVDQGKKFLYYERYKSAKDNFDKVLAANPNNIEAVYWLGQTMLEDPLLKDSVGAKNLYQKYLTQNGNAPLLLAGMGQIELMEGKTNEARQRFETALSLTKSKDVEVINAIGRANVNAKKGDPAYAIQKLTEATQIKKFNDPNTYLLMGDAYRRQIDGGNAVTAYNKALELDPKNAAAKTSIGRVYLTQGNKDYFLPAFEDAVKLDPAYAPAYFELYYYWYYRDVNKASGYLDNFVANTDQGPEQEYMKTDLLYASGKPADAKARAQQLITQYGDKVDPRMYRMVAFASDTLGDLAGAKQAMQTLFAKLPPEEIRATDYEELANIASKTAGAEAEAFEALKQAIAKDTLEENKVKYITKGAALAKKLGNRAQEAVWLGEAVKLKKEPSQNDLYQWGMANYQAKNFVTADSIFCGVFQSKYPNAIYGYLWCARNALASDTTLEKGAIVGPYSKLIAFADTARDKYKAVLLESHGYLAQYYANVAKQKDSAIAHLEKIIEIDPSNADAPKYIEALKRPAQQPRQSTPTSKPAGNKQSGTAPKRSENGTR